MNGAIKRRESINIRNVKGVRVIPAPPNPQGFKNGDITVFNLHKMSKESIDKYGLTKYLKQLKGGLDE